MLNKAFQLERGQEKVPGKGRETTFFKPFNAVRIGSRGLQVYIFPL